MSRPPDIPVYTATPHSDCTISEQRSFCPCDLSPAGIPSCRPPVNPPVDSQCRNPICDNVPPMSGNIHPEHRSPPGMLSRIVLSQCTSVFGLTCSIVVRSTCNFGLLPE